MAAQRHSIGAYLAGSVPSVRLVIARACAVWSVALVQAQSMAPIDADVGVLPFTFGDSTMVFPSRLVGMPLPELAAMAITTGQGLADPVMKTLLTYLLARWLDGTAL